MTVILEARTPTPTSTTNPGRDLAMNGYTLHVTHPGAETTAHLETLDDLADRVAVEQLAHELNPLDPAGYVVIFTVTSDAGGRGPAGSSAVADGRFHVRATSTVASPVETANRSN